MFFVRVDAPGNELSVCVGWDGFWNEVVCQGVIVRMIAQAQMQPTPISAYTNSQTVDTKSHQTVDRDPDQFLAMGMENGA